jgi:hypothetical protein
LCMDIIWRNWSDTNYALERYMEYIFMFNVYCNIFRSYHYNIIL